MPCCIPLFNRKRPPGPLVLTLAIVIMLGLCFFVSMAPAALFTWPALRRAERMLGEFREGRYLVRWDYSPEEWEAYVASLERDVNTINWWIAAVILVPLWIAAIAGALDPQPDALRQDRLELVAGGHQPDRGRCHRGWSAVCPRPALPTAPRGDAACVHRLPGRLLRRRLQLLGDGHAGVAERSPAPRSAARAGIHHRHVTARQNASTAVTLVTAVSGHPAHVASYAMRHIVPIPTSAEAEAERLVREFTQRGV